MEHCIETFRIFSLRNPMAERVLQIHAFVPTNRFRRHAREHCACFSPADRGPGPFWVAAGVDGALHRENPDFFSLRHPIVEFFLANPFVCCEKKSVSADFQRKMSFALRRTVARGFSGWRREWMEHCIEKFRIFSLRNPIVELCCTCIRLLRQIGFG